MCSQSMNNKLLATCPELDAGRATITPRYKPGGSLKSHTVSINVLRVFEMEDLMFMGLEPILQGSISTT